ncbi:hypothetical protein L210DRAFT_2988139 [Boletus edulis BED1]|uniref:Uncharacterized protein n=1 Tax=Boletus edulis BED1 TaxID=1328754 RepID=A0AAD4BA47_BOLED|nr:hypothetical protein L210DRAFT_2988139 [Boletus edulis BED1]
MPFLTCLILTRTRVLLNWDPPPYPRLKRVTLRALVIESTPATKEARVRCLSIPSLNTSLPQRSRYRTCPRTHSKMSPVMGRE